MSDPVSNLLPRLEKVRECGPNKWQACCPAHDDRDPSLSIARGDDGRVLLKCWAGCSALEVMESVGLTLSDLFEGRTHHRHPPSNKRLYPNYRKILELLRHELTVLMIAAEALNNNKTLTECEYNTVSRAYINLSRILESANV
jgi:hypothetical protein